MALETPEGPLKPIVYLGVGRDDEILLVQYETPPNPDNPGTLEG